MIHQKLLQIGYSGHGNLSQLGFLHSNTIPPNGPVLSQLFPDSKESVPRPVAKLSVTVAAAAVSLFVLRSFMSTALFAVGTMGFIYFIYLALNKDKGSKTDVGSKSSDDALEEAKRIMDKYK